MDFSPIALLCRGPFYKTNEVLLMFKKITVLLIFITLAYAGKAVYEAYREKTVYEAVTKLWATLIMCTLQIIYYACVLIGW
jgi:hypothetical protein